MLGVDLQNPPRIDHFDFFYQTLGDPNKTIAMPSHRAGARFYSEPPVGSQPPSMNIILPPEAFQDSRHRKRSLSPSSHDSRSSDHEWQPRSGATGDIPTVRKWLDDLEIEEFTYHRWDFLHEAFANEESLDITISDIAHLPFNTLKSGYNLKMVDAIFLENQLGLAAKQYGFQVNHQKARRKKHRS
jgi:hypothetical protein